MPDVKYKFLKWLYQFIEGVPVVEDQFLYHKGHSDLVLFFILKGRVDLVLNYEYKPYWHYTEGDVFGLEDFILNCPQQDRYALNDGNIKLHEYRLPPFREFRRSNSARVSSSISSIFKLPFQGNFYVMKDIFPEVTDFLFGLQLKQMKRAIYQKLVKMK